MKCGYPPCAVDVQTGGESPPLFCTEHRAVKCNYPPCEGVVVDAGADTCHEHYELVKFFTWIHQIRHMQQGQMVARAKQAEAIKQQLFGRGNGGKGGGQIIRGR